MFGYDLGVDLGTSKIAISVPGKGVVLNEPSYVAYDTETEKVLYAGKRAYFLEGREPRGVSVAQPIKEGVISNYALTQQMVHHFINRVIKKNIFKPRVVAAVPALTTDVEKRTLVSVIITAGARSVCLIEEPLCAAFGAGIDPIHPSGVFVIDIGGGRSDMAIISQGAMSQVETLNIAGDAFDEAIVQYFRDKYQVLIGTHTAEDIKTSIGCAVERTETVTMAAKGRSLQSGLPEMVEVDSSEICECLQPLLAQIADTSKAMFSRTSPQLVSDITSGEVLLSGGSAALYGLDTYLAEALELDVRVVPNPALCVARGAEVALSKMRILDRYGYGFKTKEDVRIR